MPAITALSIFVTARIGRAFAVAIRSVRRGLGRIASLLKNRRDAGRLSGLDDRMLADIGLTRSDLRDAYSEPLWQDPTDILARRAAERRTRYRMPSQCYPPVSCGARLVA